MRRNALGCQLYAFCWQASSAVLMNTKNLKLEKMTEPRQAPKAKTRTTANKLMCMLLPNKKRNGTIIN